MKKYYHKLFKNTFTTILTVVISVLFITVTVFAATTISSNISTGGTLAVTGLSTFSRATSTSATTTDYMYIGVDISEPTGWNFAGGDLIASGDVFFNNQATTSVSHWFGSGGTANYINLQGGDIYVQNDAEIDGTLYFNRATGTSATTTAYLYVGVDVSEPTGFDFSGDLAVSDDLYINDRATSSNAFWIGDGGTANNIDVDEDLYVEGDTEIDGGLWVNSATTTGSFVAGGNATTTGKTVLGSAAPATNATTTITFGSNSGADKQGLCLKFFSGGVTMYCYLQTSGSIAFVCSTNSCE